MIAASADNSVDDKISKEMTQIARSPNKKQDDGDANQSSDSGVTPRTS